MYYSDSNEIASMIGVMLFAGLALTFMLIGYVVSSIFLSFMFKKANVDMWKAWVPFYNSWVMFELAGYKGWLAIAALVAAPLLAGIPFIGFVISVAVFILMIMVAVNLQRAYSKQPVFALLYVFLPIVWFGILAFDRSEYDAEKLAPVTPASFAK